MLAAMFNKGQEYPGCSVYVGHSLVIGCTTMQLVPYPRGGKGN